MSSYQVILNFSDGTYNYDLPHIFELSDPQPDTKATIIHGNRADGAIYIPGGKKATEITVKGTLYDTDGFADLETLIEELKTKITTDVATLTFKYWTGSIWQNIWQKTVRRIGEIELDSASLRTDSISYTVKFLIISY